MTLASSSLPLDAEQTLRHFYRHYKSRFVKFCAAIQGIPTIIERTQYAHLLINRLIFLFFLQQQGWLNGDTHYLSHHFHIHTPTLSNDTFYRSFLLPFWQQLYSPTTTFVLTASLAFGTFPRFKLALFALHPLEYPSTSINIPDNAFTELFAFFNSYHWSLDNNSPLSTNTLLPDVLSYLLEQQVNQKETGAYYTKDDVTDYIAQNTIIPYLLQSIQAQAPTLLPLIQQLQHTDPDRYIQPAQQCSTPLPLETFYSYKKRRRYYQQLRELVLTSSIATIDDLITLHLDMQCLLHDVLLTTNDPSLLLTCYTQLEQIAILDPTCGCGAFLLAALDFLTPLYYTCLDRMAALQQDRHLSLAMQHAFQTILQRMSYTTHPRAAVISTIIQHNLYGVDIMHEAIDICKQRLILRLLQTLSPTTTLAHGIPPTLATFDLDTHLYIGNALTRTTDAHEQQESHNDYKPLFDWHIAFDSIMQRGGFDVIIGNPPYIERSRLRDKTQPETATHWGNLYAAVIERSLALCRTDQSYLGLIVPLSLCSSERFKPLRQTLLSQTTCLWLANFEIFPCRIFEGAYQRLSLLLAYHGTAQPFSMYVTHLQRWYSVERPYLFQLVTYTPVRHTIRLSAFPKLASSIQEDILHKLATKAQGHSIAHLLATQPTTHTIYYQEATNNWIKAVCHIPFYRKNGQVTEPPHGRLLFLHDELTARALMAVMNSGLFYLWFATYSDGFHLSHTLVKEFPLTHGLLTVEALQQLSYAVEADIKIHARLSTRNARSIRHKASDSIELEEYYMLYSKPLLDKIDAVLAHYYAFTDEELDFIIHYDIKYRMGKAYPHGYA